VNLKRDERNYLKCENKTKDFLQIDLVTNVEC